MHLTAGVIVVVVRVPAVFSVLCGACKRSPRPPALVYDGVAMTAVGVFCVRLPGTALHLLGAAGCVTLVFCRLGRCAPAIHHAGVLASVAGKQVGCCCLPAQRPVRNICTGGCLVLGVQCPLVPLVVTLGSCVLRVLFCGRLFEVGWVAALSNNIMRCTYTTPAPVCAAFCCQQFLVDTLGGTGGRGQTKQHPCQSLGTTTRSCMQGTCMTSTFDVTCTTLVGAVGSRDVLPGCRNGLGPVAVVGGLRHDWTLHRAVC